MKSLPKVALAGFVILLLYLTWSPQQRKVIIKKSGLVKDNSHLTTASVSIDLFIARQKMLEEHCHGANLTKVRPPRTMLYSKQLHLAYCPLPMTASTALKYAMLLSEGMRIHSHVLYNVSYQQAIHSDAQKLALRSSPEKVNGEADVLLIVRDPWQRLISIYKSQIEDKSQSFYVLSCQRVLKTDKIITFDLFLQCIITAAETGYKLGTHLLPASQLCSLCKIKYNRIGKSNRNFDKLHCIIRHS